MSGAVVPAAGTLFEQDDQETLDLLLLPSTEASNDDNKDEIASRLRTTASLFCEDFKVNEVFWNDTIIKSAKNVGFQVDIISAPPFSNHTDSNTTPQQFQPPLKRILANCTFKPRVVCYEFPKCVPYN